MKESIERVQRARELYKRDPLYWCLTPLTWDQLPDNVCDSYVDRIRWWDEAGARLEEKTRVIKWPTQVKWASVDLLDDGTVMLTGSFQ